MRSKGVAGKTGRAGGKQEGQQQRKQDVMDVCGVPLCARQVMSPAKAAQYVTAYSADLTE